MSAKHKPDIVLSSGRVISHSLEPSGAWLATPTTGPDEMTEPEWLEYCEIIKTRAGIRVTEENIK